MLENGASDGTDTEEPKPLSHLQSKVSPRLMAGFGAAIVEADLYRIVFRAWLSKMIVEMGIPEDADPNLLRDAYVERVFKRMRAIQLQLVRLDHVFTF